jgi:hypothetical protein
VIVTPTGVAGLQFIEDIFRFMDAARFDISHPAANCGVEGQQPALALFHKPQRIAHHFVGAAIAASGKLRLHKRFEMIPKGEAVGHGFDLRVILLYDIY